MSTASTADRAFEASFRYFLGPLMGLLEDEAVSEIMVSGPDKVFVERGGRLEPTDVRFADEDALRAAANNIAQFVGKTIDDENPILDGRLDDGSRVCIVLAPLSAHGTSINIRRFSREARSPQFLIDAGALTPEALEFIVLAVRAHTNVVVSGGTGSGKTTLLNILSSTIDDAERILVIEDTRELQIQKPHVVQMEARPADAHGRGRITVRDLFVTSLRMRPDRIIVGEVRGGEALDLVQAMTSGHRGSLATLHADTPAQTCSRLETMCLLADVGLPLAALRRQVSLALDLVVQTTRLSSGRRLVTHVSEIELDDTTGTLRHPRRVWPRHDRGATRVALDGAAAEAGRRARVERARRRGAADPGALWVSERREGGCARCAATAERAVRGSERPARDGVGARHRLRRDADDPLDPGHACYDPPVLLPRRRGRPPPVPLTRPTACENAPCCPEPRSSQRASTRTSLAPNTVEWVLLIIVALVVLAGIYLFIKWALGSLGEKKDEMEGAQDGATPSDF